MVVRTTGYHSFGRRNLQPSEGAGLAGQVSTPLTGVLSRDLRKRLQTAFVAIAAALAGAALTAAYAALLVRAEVPASIPALLAVLFASTLSSIAGFAFSAICGGLLLRIMADPVQVVETMMVCSIAIQSLSVAVLRRDIDWRPLLTFSLGGVFGLPLGVWLLLHLGHVGFKDAIGGVLTGYAGYLLLARPVTVRHGGTAADLCIGFLGGITGGLAGLPGAAVTIWCGMRGWDKRYQRGIYQPFILIMQVLALVLIEVMRPRTLPGGGLNVGALAFVPAALLGTVFGLTIFGRMSDRTFKLTVNLLLLLSGLSLLM